MNETALLTNTNPKADGVANHSLEDNWLDDVRFGFHDAIVGLYAVDAFRALGDLKTWLGDPTGAAAAYATHARAVAAYNAAYWDEGAGMYRDWVDATGRARTYFYTWQNFYAVELGVASPAQASAIMGRADSLYAGLRAQYNVTADELWCTPTNLIPLDPLDLTVDFDSEYVYPHYENGESTPTGRQAPRRASQRAQYTHHAPNSPVAHRTRMHCHQRTPPHCRPLPRRLFSVAFRARGAGPQPRARRGRSVRQARSRCGRV